jgi:UDP-N-acetylmuramyl pentapeptide phosphotransferase/UDP-N-acetylglucosamine-1-phosphate transferase
MVSVWFLLIFITCAALSLLLCYTAKLLFPRFRSGEFKPGLHRADLQPGFHRSGLPASGREIKTIELPLVGGPALILSLIMTGIAAGFLLKFNQDQWTLLLIGLGATFCYMLVGFADDWFKVFSKEGLSERAKFVGLLVVSIAAALLYFFLLDSGKQPYTPYIDLPIIGPIISPLLCANHHNQPPYCQSPVHIGLIAYITWLILLTLISSVIGTVTPLSVDFSDGLDGLAGGLVFSAALAFGIIITGNLTNPSGVVLEVLSLLCAGSTLGYLAIIMGGASSHGQETSKNLHGGQWRIGPWWNPGYDCYFFPPGVSTAHGWWSICFRRSLGSYPGQSHSPAHLPPPTANVALCGKRPKEYTSYRVSPAIPGNTTAPPF